MNLKKYLSVILLLVISYSSFSQVDTIAKKNNRVWTNLKYDANVTFNSVKNSFTQPLRWKKDDFLTAAGVVAGTGLLYFADNEARPFFARQEKDIPSGIRHFGFYLGKPQTFFAFTAGVYGFGLITDNEKVRRAGILVLSGAISSGLIQSVSKTVVGRSRPSNGEHDEFDFYSNEAGFHSFPSGHSVLAFTIAHAVAKQFDNFWAKAGIYAVGSITPISRLWSEAHWISDVGLGMVLGVVVVDGIDNFMNKKAYYGYQKPKNISWNLRAGYKTLGIVGTF